VPLASHPALAGDLAAAAARLRAVTVAVHAGAPTRRGLAASGHGSGVVWRRDGLVVTNAHVARTAHAVVTLPDGRRLAARTVARDPARDLALLELDAGALPPDALTAATPGDPSRLRPGEVVLALGHPLGHANALAAGIVHAAGDAGPPPWLRGRGTSAPVRVVQADVRLLPGNSGGPLADAAGRVVGINAMVVGGLGVAIAVDEVAALVRALDRAAARRAA
jgi:serine protease Do